MVFLSGQLHCIFMFALASWPCTLTPPSFDSCFLLLLKYFLRQWSFSVLCFMLFVCICFTSFVSTQSLPQRRTGKRLKEPIDLSKWWKELDAVLLCARGCAESPASLDYLQLKKCCSERACLLHSHVFESVVLLPLPHGTSANPSCCRQQGQCCTAELGAQLLSA